MQINTRIVDPVTGVYLCEFLLIFVITSDISSDISGSDYLPSKTQGKYYFLIRDEIKII
jgi:hypothetical protein